MRFQYISDIHLERGTKIDIERAHGDVLLLAGDVGDPSQETYRAFLAKMASMFDHVVVIAGNHEFYSRERSMNTTRQALRTIAPECGAHFLDDEFYDIPDTDITVYGTTLWSEVDNQSASLVTCMISDYRCIPGFTVPTNNALHAKAKLAFRTGLLPRRRYVVLCHHVPHTRLVDRKYSGSPLNAAFASDVPEFEHPSVIAVVYGHTHTPHRHGNYYCNPVGYPGENARPSCDAWFEV